MSLPQGATVADLLSSLKLGPTGVAIAVNQAVIPSSQRSRTRIQSADRVEIIQAVGGG